MLHGVSRLFFACWFRFLVSRIQKYHGRKTKTVLPPKFFRIFHTHRPENWGKLVNPTKISNSRIASSSQIVVWRGDGVHLDHTVHAIEWSPPRAPEFECFRLALPGRGLPLAKIDSQARPLSPLFPPIPRCPSETNSDCNPSAYENMTSGDSDSI